MTREQEQQTLTWFLNARALTDALATGANYSDVAARTTWTYGGNGWWVDSRGNAARY